MRERKRDIERRKKSVNDRRRKGMKMSREGRRKSVREAGRKIFRFFEDGLKISFDLLGWERVTNILSCV